MAFNLRQLDKLSYDEVEPILEDYINGALQAFAKSPEGKAHIRQYPDGGFWISTLIEIGYGYGEVTLPKMTQGDVQTLMESTLPRKILLTNAAEAEDAIPELVAFWTFLQREHKLRSAAAIIKYLKTLATTFPGMMMDPARAGMAKSIMGGQNPFAAPIPVGVPPEFVALLSQRMGLGTVPGLEHLPSDPTQLVRALAHHLVETGAVELAPSPDELAAAEDRDIFQQLQVDTLQLAAQDQGLELSEKASTLLQQQTITATEPGTIVQDFDRLLAIMGDRGLPVSGKRHLFSSMQLLADLNAQLSQPIQIDLQRPQQKSYPNVHGLYLLLRATEIAELVSVGKTTCLKPNPEHLAAWQSLNPTEKYFTLLEAWVIRASAELLGEGRDPLKDGTRVLRMWSQKMAKPQTYRDYNIQTNLNYWPGLYNLALMQMFGWVTINSPKPEAGKGWRVKQVTPLPWGDAIATLLLNAYVEQHFIWPSEQDFNHPWGQLQPYVQPFFPEWQHNLPSPAPLERQTGTYVFKVSLGKIWRRIAISSESTLEALASLILTSVDFDSDHLYLFSFRDRAGRTIEVHHPANDWQNAPRTDEVLIGDLPLKPGMSMTYLFDFGDHWEFDLLLEAIQPGQPKRNSNKILERHGKAPKQ
jgi:hypothetical protein